MLQIRPQRIAQDIEVIAGFNESSPDIGFSRPTFTPSWQNARDYVITQAKAIGCTIRIDAAGNIHARPASLPLTAKTWLAGSHIDSVPTGGKFDGVVGIVAPLEVLRCQPKAPLELVIFAEEEGTTFNLGMLGSRAWAGTLAVDQLSSLRNKQGQNYIEAGIPYGVDPARLSTDCLNAALYHGLIELHIEQGPAMWNHSIAVAPVTAINGRRQFTCTITGQANHAGSTKMTDRDDALVTAADIVVSLQQLGLDLNAALDHTVITVGRLNVEPNGLNVIPGRVTFYIDFRARDNAMLDRGEQRIRDLITTLTGRRKSQCELLRTEALPATPMDAAICQRLRDAATRLGIAPFPDVASGALHDSAILAPLLPTAMLFIASKGGLSHNPAEFSRIEDIVLATRILAEVVINA